MEFNYASSFGGSSPEAYERLILDVMAGDATLFMRRDQVEAAWQFVTPILDRWEQAAVRDLPEYQCGTWGPIEAGPSDRSRWPLLEELVTASEPFAAGGSVPVPLRGVEAELVRQMKPPRGAGGHPVHFARMSNLVIFCDQREQAEQLAAEVSGRGIDPSGARTARLRRNGFRRCSSRRGRPGAAAAERGERGYLLLDDLPARGGRHGGAAALRRARIAGW